MVYYINKQYGKETVVGPLVHFKDSGKVRNRQEGKLPPTCMLPRVQLKGVTQTGEKFYL